MFKHRKSKVRMYHQTGGLSLSGLGSALGKIGSATASGLGKIASNQAVQQLAKTGLEVGTAVGTQALINKINQSEQGRQVADALAKANELKQNATNVVDQAKTTKEQIKQMYVDGLINKDQVRSLLKEYYQSGGVRNLRRDAKRRQVVQQGGIAPALLAAPALAVGAAVLGGLLSPVFEEISRKHIASKI